VEDTGNTGKILVGNTGVTEHMEYLNVGRRMILK
jgi:hypothetical protein